jgi:hypothetical protein
VLIGDIGRFRRCRLPVAGTRPDLEGERRPVCALHRAYRGRLPFAWQELGVFRPKRRCCPRPSRW